MLRHMYKIALKVERQSYPYFGQYHSFCKQIVEFFLSKAKYPPDYAIPPMRDAFDDPHDAGVGPDEFKYMVVKDDVVLTTKETEEFMNQLYQKVVALDFKDPVDLYCLQ